MKEKRFHNKLNDLTTKEWIKFQKSWFIHNPPPRKKNVLRHPGKFPETLVEEFIKFFTKRGQTVLDPMVGTGSVQIAAIRSGRHSYGIELNPDYAEIARGEINKERESIGLGSDKLIAATITGDAANLDAIARNNNFPIFDYIITSPPYWDMLHAKGASTQKERRGSDHLDITYSDSMNDLGNIKDYDDFIDSLVLIYKGVKPCIKPGGYITIIVKNIKKGGKIYPLAWDLGKMLAGTYTLKDERIWMQDNQPLFPYGMGNAWVSNTFHHYCLQFRNE